MKKNLLLWTLAILPALQGMAQNKSILSLSVGPSLPGGEYGNLDVNSPTSGLADLGALAAISYRYALSKHWGLVTSAKGRFNGVNANSTLGALEPSFPGYNWSVNHARWITTALMIGGFYRLAVSTKVELSATIQWGGSYSSSPDETITGVHDSVGYGPNDLVRAQVGTISAFSFTSMAGISAAYRLNSRWYLVAQLDYWVLDPSFRNLTEKIFAEQNLGPNGIPSLQTTAQEDQFTRDYVQAMNSLDLSVGMAYRLSP